ncbi:Type 2 DNA topoisomerase 6 subunit B [Candidatus Anstonella stagnisolia]|nr:Type 2 DNA topoisomerase 6 subunit B [Candidatus Anstonella stagnisolia]
MPTSTDKIFSEFKEHSVAEFFKKNKQMLGFSGKTRSLTTIVHEYVTNSLDACEEAGILAQITVKIEEVDKEKYRVTTEDNGPGIPKKHIGKALGQMLAGTKFHRYMQQRGQQGIGASGCTMYAQITTGKPVKATSFYDKKMISCEVAVDLKTNSAILTNVVEQDTDGSKSGLVVEGEFADVKYDKSSFGVFEYMKRTAMANPHAQFTLIEPTGESVTFPRTVAEIPKKAHSVLPHPLGISTNDLLDLAHRDTDSTKISVFLQNKFSRISAARVKELRDALPAVDFEKAPKDITWSDAEALVKAFTSVKWIAPETDSVIPIGKEQIEKSLQSILAPQFLSVTERPVKIYKGGVPFAVEVAIAYGGHAGRQLADKFTSDVMRFANRVPLLFDNSGCAISEAVKEVDWKRYNIKNFDEEPITLFINLASVYVPYTSAGKQAISSEEDVFAEIKYAVMEAARDLQRYLSGITRDRDKKERRKAVLRYVGQLSKDVVELAGSGKSADVEKKLMNLIETKYSTQIEEDESEIDAPKENGNGKEEDEGEE